MSMRPAIRRPLAPGALARAALALSCSACLVVSPPEYDRPTQTPPYLIATQATPSLGALINVGQIDEATPPVNFGAAVLSEDDGEPVQIALYIDYGKVNAANLPYKNLVYPFGGIEAGTLAQGPRTFGGINWYLQSVPVGEGCHTVTMMASHAFDQTNVCPADPKDSSYLVWRLVNCGAGATSCPTECPDTACTTAPCPSCETQP